MKARGVDLDLAASLIYLGAAFRERRIAACLTQRVLADMTQIPVRELSKCENGRQDVGFDAFVRLAWWHGVQLTFTLVTMKKAKT